MSTKYVDTIDETGDNDEEDSAPRRGCCSRMCACFREHRLNMLLLCICGGALTMVYFHGANGWWFLAALSIGRPVALVVVWCIDLALQRALADMTVVLWYTSVLLKYATPTLWALIIIPVLQWKPITLDVFLRACCWLIVIICVIRAVTELGLHLLHHVLSVTDSKSARAEVQRALMVLAHLHHRARGLSLPNQTRAADAAGGASDSDTGASVTVSSGAGAGAGAGAVAHGSTPGGQSNVTSTGGATPTPTAADDDSSGSADKTGYASPSAVSTEHSPGGDAGRGVGDRAHRDGAPANVAADDAALDATSTSPATLPSAMPGTPHTVSGTPGPQAPAGASGGAPPAGTATGDAGVVVPLNDAAIAVGGTATPGMFARASQRARPGGGRVHARAPRILSVKFNQAVLDSFLGQLEEADTLQSAAEAIFEFVYGRPNRTDKDDVEVMTQKRLYTLLSPKDVAIVAKHTHMSSSGFTLGELRRSIHKLYSDFHARTKAGHSKYTWILRALIDIFLGVTAPIIFILLMGANPVSVFVPVGSTLLAASFVFARSMQDLMTCVVFVLMQHPYDVGDVVVVDKTAYRVSGIRLMQTSMINTKTKQKLYMPNVVLARMFIENDERSPHARATVDIYVDPGVTALQIKLLHERLTDFMRHESPDDWMQPAEPYVIASDVRPSDGKVCLSIWASTWIPWSKRKAVNKARGTIMVAALRALRDMGVRHERPPVDIHLTELAARRREEPVGGGGDDESDLDDARVGSFVGDASLSALRKRHLTPLRT